MYAIVLLVRHLGNRECIGSVVLLFVVWRVRSIFYQLVGLGWVDFFSLFCLLCSVGSDTWWVVSIGSGPVIVSGLMTIHVAVTTRDANTCQSLHNSISNDCRPACFHTRALRCVILDGHLQTTWNYYTIGLHSCFRKIVSTKDEFVAENCIWLILNARLFPKQQKR